WSVYGNTLHTMQDDVPQKIEFDAMILATGATDRLLPVKGWTLPGCYSLGAAQIALKAQACAIGRSVVFMGTGPLLYMVSYQYAKAGVNVVAVLDTSPFDGQLRALPQMASRPMLLAKGMYYRAQLWKRKVPVYSGVRPLEIQGHGSVEGVQYTDASGQERFLACDAVAMGFHLRSETQLADLARCRFIFDETLAQWAPESDIDGRTSVFGIYVAGDGARVLGADAAEISGQLAALALLEDLGKPIDVKQCAALRKQQRKMEMFRRGLAKAFPWPSELARSVADDVILCRCEAITAGDVRRSAVDKFAPELNRAKALVRVGMGRCQGRFCGSAAAEILADARKAPLESTGRLRGQAPVKPLPTTYSRKPSQ
ncbi:FAD/NAD(P)-dependent oxidoreductase, partial [Massilia cavernae]